jgi:hypothetical protein
MSTPRIVIATAATVTALLVSGSAIALAGTNGPATVRPAAVGPVSSATTVSTTTPTSSTEPARRTAAPGDLSRDDAAAIALAHVGAGRVTKVEQEVEHGRREWKVEVVDGTRRHDVRVDAASGAITRVDANRDDRGNDDRGNDDRGRGSDDSRGHDVGDDKGGDR